MPDGVGTVEMEAELLRVVMERVWNRMAPAEREEALRRAGGPLGAAAQEAARQNGGIGAVSLSLLAVLGGAQLMRLLLPEVIAVAAGFVPAVAAGAMGAAAGVLVGPVGWVAGAAWAAAEIAGPSYRGLAPAVFKVAELRQRLLWADEEDTVA